jgi:histidine triad (HIT) family protein
MSCVFCKIVAGEIPATVVARTPEAVAFRDLNPQAPTHVLVVPTRHVSGVSETDSEEGEALVAKTVRLAVQTARSLGLEGGGYRLVVNDGAGAGQSVFHLHVHLLGGRRMGWPPG